ncbi:helix-turn-helix domain-containing protein [Rhodococcoides corynebacterioides]|uniref:helix-turn-helix domain-containing protein n=1 Tax=Rhodococcoides corynebacterioides TaxID=53972 RepID=UPI003F804B67
MAACVCGTARMAEPGPTSQRVIAEFDARAGKPLPGNEAVARALHVSEPHLRRLLANEATTLGRLRARYNAGLAVDALRRGEPIELLALRLGYAEPRGFRRAFRRWTGMAPSEVRAA